MRSLFTNRSHLIYSLPWTVLKGLPFCNTIKDSIVQTKYTVNIHTAFGYCESCASHIQRLQCHLSAPLLAHWQNIMLFQCVPFNPCVSSLNCTVIEKQRIMRWILYPLLSLFLDMNAGQLIGSKGLPLPLPVWRLLYRGLEEFEIKSDTYVYSRCI